MTTTAAPTFDETVDFTERTTQRKVAAAREAFAARVVSDFVSWNAEDGLQAEATLRFLRVARKGGADALTEALARTLGDTSRGSALVDMAVQEQTRRAALDTLRTFKRFLDPAAFLAAF